MERIEDAGMSVEVLAAFRRALGEVAGASGLPDVEQALLAGMFDRLVPPDADPAPFDELWPHAELFLTTALTIAVSDGRYGVEEARVIGSLASRLGYSVKDLTTIEAKVFEDLRARGRALRGS
ncbi:MAG: hypothetical protein Q8P41_24255 [Pseudomonadota bacterium]|nr:hypothetical protein [Pseudomonadota bacterium]